MIVSVSFCVYVNEPMYVLVSLFPNIYVHIYVKFHIDRQVSGAKHRRKKWIISDPVHIDNTNRELKSTPLA